MTSISGLVKWLHASLTISLLKISEVTFWNSPYHTFLWLRNPIFSATNLPLYSLYAPFPSLSDQNIRPFHKKNKNTQNIKTLKLKSVGWYIFLPFFLRFKVPRRFNRWFCRCNTKVSLFVVNFWFSEGVVVVFFWSTRAFHSWVLLWFEGFVGVDLVSWFLSFWSRDKGNQFLNYVWFLLLHFDQVLVVFVNKLSMFTFELITDCFT